MFSIEDYLFMFNFNNSAINFKCVLKHFDHGLLNLDLIFGVLLLPKNVGFRHFSPLGIKFAEIR